MRIKESPAKAVKKVVKNYSTLKSVVEGTRRVDGCYTAQPNRRTSEDKSKTQLLPGPLNVKVWLLLAPVINDFTL